MTTVADGVTVLVALAATVDVENEEVEVFAAVSKTVSVTTTGDGAKDVVRFAACVDVEDTDATAV